MIFDRLSLIEKITKRICNGIGKTNRNQYILIHSFVLVHLWYRFPRIYAQSIVSYYYYYYGKMKRNYYYYYYFDQLLCWCASELGFHGFRRNIRYLVIIIVISPWSREGTRGRWAPITLVTTQILLNCNRTVNCVNNWWKQKIWQRVLCRICSKR